ncbi:inositol-3-phosphate synthase [Ancylostoma caninum]|uniref:Inositol-3-phosphate synthase n=1 Tax=Ancylostoma caninum TaxID=29170 RepID=A0A368FK15_ANCCA|nr:inositol-3-phosphate synthase [Ancylostoma caninum]
MNGLSNGCNGATQAEQMPRRLIVDSPYVRCDGNEIETTFHYRKNHFSHTAEGLKVSPKEHEYLFKTQLKPKKTGLLLVGLGGNNGSTSVGAIYANKKHMTWRTKDGVQTANYFGSVTQASTVHLGWDGEQQIHVPFNEIIPILSPNDLIIDGWDINNKNLYEAMIRAKVFEPELQEKLRPYMEPIVPMPSIYYPDFIAANQGDRANNVIPGTNKKQHLAHIRRDIRNFKEKHDLECVIVLWTANTERYTDVVDGLNMTAEQMLASIDKSADEVSPSNIFAVAAILEGAHYINGSPQNTLVPGIIELAHQHNVFVGGDDFKSGQTKIKSALVDFLVSSGLKPESIVSYNHLGNNDGKNLSEARQFRSKEISKSSVVDDMVQANKILYPTGKNPDHCIVIKYVPFVGDSKRAMDEYICSIFMGGRQTFVIHNTCEDSLLASPLIYDLAILTELATRIRYADATDAQFRPFHEVLSILSLLLKAPVVPPGTPVSNAFMRQFASLSKLVTVLAGVASDTDMQIEFFTHLPKAQ